MSVQNSKVLSLVILLVAVGQFRHRKIGPGPLSLSIAAQADPSAPPLESEQTTPKLPVPDVPVACTYYVSPTGSDSSPGSLIMPWKTLRHGFDKIGAGQTLCLRGGTYAMTVPGGYNQVLDRSGMASSPMVIANYPGEIAIIQGNTRINGAYVRLVGTPAPTPGLVFEGPTGQALGLIDVMNTHDVILDHVEIRHADYHAGFYQHGGYNIKMIGCYVHDNGRPAEINTDQGIYWDSTTGGGNLVANCLVEHNASTGIQLYPRPSQVTVADNTIAGNGNYGMVVYGNHNTVVNNIFWDNGNVANNPQLEIASGNDHIIDSNIIWSTNPSQRRVVNKSNQVITNLIIADPLLLDPLRHNYHLRPGSPAIEAGNGTFALRFDKDGLRRGLRPGLGAYKYAPQQAITPGL